MRETVTEERILSEDATVRDWIGRRAIKGGLEYDRVAGALAKMDSVPARDIAAFVNGSSVPIDRKALFGRVVVVVLPLVDDPLKLRARHAEGGLEDVLDFVQSVYAKPETHVEALERNMEGNSTTLVAVPLRK